MLGRYLLALLLTIVIEGCVAWLFGFRTGRYMLALAVINVTTNITLNCLLFVLAFVKIIAPIAFIVALEAGVVIVEWQMLVYVFDEPRRRFLLLSVLTNATSFLIGLLLFWM